MSKRLTLAVLLFLGIVVPLWGVYLLTRPAERFVVQAQLDVAPALNSRGNSQFVQVLQPRDFYFPEDHGPHPEYGVEWWYYTGNLDSQEGSHFGFELTLFRVALASEIPERSSDWAASQLYMGHFALTDVKNRQFYAFERFSREALGLAGASVVDDWGFRAWLEDWSVEGEGTTKPTIRLKASEGEIAVDLTLVSEKALILQGDRGFSQKSAGIGNASYYYSITRMPTTGTVSIGARSYVVDGSSWMDREWSSSALSEEQEGWDWFALQLSDGRDLMYYQLRLKDGGIDPFSGGTLVSADGSTLPITANDVELRVLEHWDSPQGDSYPVRWQLKVPSQSIDVEVTPYIKNQELEVSVRYWEGAVKVAGKSNGLPVGGNGYVEMTGYAEGARGRSPE